VRILFCGTPASAVPSLEAVAGGPPRWEVVGVLTQPDRPAGRGRRLRPSPVRAAAEERALRVMTPEKPKHARAELEELRPDAIAVVAYGHIFRRWLLELPPLGCVNVHFSLLPRHRGTAPVAWAILSGDAETGVTTMRMDRGVDTGGTYLAEHTVIRPDDTTDRLTARLAEMGASLLVRTLERLEAGTIEPAAQDESRATRAPRLEKEDGRIDWGRPAEEIERRVRGLASWPGAFTTWRGRGLKVHAAAVSPGTLAPGVLRVRDGRVEVGTGHGVLQLVEVQPEGKPRMEAEAWLRGARPDPGAALGTAP
jgi:methionyl-tRNA formyltransferase